MVDGIIFDMDGTLVDFVDQCTNAWNESSKKHNWNKVFTNEDLKSIMGLRAEEIANKLFNDVDFNEGLKRVDICLDEEINYLNLHIGKSLASEEDLKKLNKDYPLFIVSNCMSGYIEAYLNNYNFNCYFLEYKNAANGKSKAENISSIVNKFALKNPLYVGDTIKDLEAANKANVRFVLASYGFGNITYKYSINSFSELLDFIKKN